MAGLPGLNGGGTAAVVPPPCKMRTQCLFSCYQFMHSIHFTDKLLAGIHSRPTTHKHEQNAAAITDYLCDARMVSQTSDCK